MRTDGSDPGRRQLAAGLWRRVLGLGMAGRLGLLAALAVALVAGLGYWSVPTDPVGGTARVFGGHAFADDRIDTVRAVLGGAGISRIVVDGSGRVSVPTAQLLVAQAALKKAKLDPRTLADIVTNRGEAPLFEDPDTRRRRLDRASAETVELLIGEIAGIAEAHVVYTPLATPGFAPKQKTAKVLVDLRTEDGGPPSYRTIREARDLVLGVAEYAIRPEDVTLTSRGRLFLSAGDRNRLRDLLSRARAEEIAEAIDTRLADLPGVHAEVTLNVPAETTWRPGKVIANQPATLDPEPEPITPSSLLDEAVVNVVVKIPAGTDARLRKAGAGDAEADPAALADARRRLHERIRGEVNAAIPSNRRGSFAVEIGGGPAAPVITTAPPSEAPKGEWAWRPTLWPTLASGALMALAGVAVAAWMSRGRGPSSRPASSGRRGRRRGEPAHAASPNARAREFVRHNPEAAAGVLQRWVGQGEDAP